MTELVVDGIHAYRHKIRHKLVPCGCKDVDIVWDQTPGPTATTNIEDWVGIETTVTSGIQCPTCKKSVTSVISVMAPHLKDWEPPDDTAKLETDALLLSRPDLF